MDPELLEEIRALNVVLAESEDTILAVAPCPDTEHGYGTREDGTYGLLTKVATVYDGLFRCAHSTSSSGFCVEHAAQRREYQASGGVWGCVKKPPVSGCEGSTLVRMYKFTPVPRSKR